MKHKSILALSLAGALLAPALHADELPVYRDKTLSIDQGVVFTTAGPTYYSGIKLKNNADGTFSLVQAQRHTLAVVEKAEVAINKSNPPQIVLHVSGVQVDLCAGLEEPAIVRDGNHFTVLIAETLAQPGAICMPFVGVTPFQRDITLATEVPTPGQYTVVVNGKQVDFTL